MLFYLIGCLVICASVAAVCRPRRHALPAKKPFLTAERLALLAVCFLLLLTYALQDVRSNEDILRYSATYNSLQNVSVQYFLRHFADYKDPVYHFVSLLVGKLGFDFYGWKTLLSLVFVFGLYRLLMYRSANPAMSVVVFLVLGLYGFSLSGLRQTAAFAILFYTYPYLKEKKFFRFALLVVLAAMFHSTALIFLVAYPIYRLKLRPRNVLLLCAGGALAILFSGQLARLYLRLAGTEEAYQGYLESDTVLSLSGAVIFGCIWLFSVVCLYFGKSDRQDEHLCHLTLAAFFLRILAAVQVAEFFRVAMYFSVFDFLLIADACACKWQGKSIARYKTAVIALLLSVYYFISPSGNLTSYVFR